MSVLYSINQYQLNDFYNLSLGLFNPQKNYANQKIFKKIIYEYNINNKICTIPIIFQIKKPIKTQKIKLLFKNKFIGHISIDEIFKVDEKDLMYLYGVTKNNKLSHPGYFYQSQLGKYALAGKPFINNLNFDYFKKKYDFKNQFKYFFKKNNIVNPVAFQTRNPPHRGHEFQINNGLSHSKNLVINPIFGWKKKGDFREKIVKSTYNVFVKKNKKNIFFKPVFTNMRYLGPREAIHHAIIRQNLGFSYFIVGRDHAGVGRFYKKYESFKLIDLLDCNKKLKINILKLREPKFCKVCNKISYKFNCKHKIKYFNGSDIRNRLSLNMKIPSYLIDKDIVKVLETNYNKLFQ